MMLSVSTGRTMAIDSVVMWTSFLASLFLSFCQVGTAFRVYEGSNSLVDVLSKRNAEIPLIISSPSLDNNPGYYDTDDNDVSRPSALSTGQFPPVLDYVDIDTPDYSYDELRFPEPVPVSSSGHDEALAAYYWPLLSQLQQQEHDNSGLSLAKNDEDGEAEAMVLPSRRKRYTDFQESALGICAGSCMYLERITYGECYDLCDWNGRTPSPWKKYDQQKQERQLEAQRAAAASIKSSSLPANDPARVLSHRFGQRKGPRTAALTESRKSAGSTSRRGKIKLKAERPASSTSSDVRKLEAAAAAIVQNKNASGKKQTNAGRKITSPAAGTKNPGTPTGCRS